MPMKSETVGEPSQTQKEILWEPPSYEAPGIGRFINTESGTVFAGAES